MATRVVFLLFSYRSAPHLGTLETFEIFQPEFELKVIYVTESYKFRQLFFQTFKISLEQYVWSFGLISYPQAMVFLFKIDFLKWNPQSLWEYLARGFKHAGCKHLSFVNTKQSRIFVPIFYLIVPIQLYNL